MEEINKRLQNYQNLLNLGVITEKEFELKKRELLESSKEASTLENDSSNSDIVKSQQDDNRTAEENESNKESISSTAEHKELEEEEKDLSGVHPQTNEIKSEPITEEKKSVEEKEVIDETDEKDIKSVESDSNTIEETPNADDSNASTTADDKEFYVKSKLLIAGYILGFVLIGGGGLFGYIYYQNNYQNNYLNKELGDTVLFYHYDDIQGNPVAVPIAVYLNGKFEEPPYSMDEGQTFKLGEGREGEVSASKINSYINSVTSFGDKLFIINKGRKYQEVAIKNQTFFGYSDPSYTSGELYNAPSYPVMVSNPEIGTYMLNFISSYNMPVLEESLMEDHNKLENELIARIDFDGDGTPELVYKCNTYEGSFYKIYSRANGNWYMIYSGGYQGY
ncbi:hypothetical protein NMK71_05065 [Weeksellaceae bacterium KMM 9713]|uniref:DMAP1-binding domain-containing protein n=1 Tax=Profundicola chukchiensis TaxID=2961959 RepID=A0A9X4RWH8_9FLAO|nr:hypothetical protein [Profundicola chukchiensis]MDG4945777.1 hypothetical protein [Profundicola chukchiensis]